MGRWPSITWAALITKGGQRVLVLVPSLLLLRQFRRDWMESARLPFVDLVVCSDETTVGRDEVRVRTADLGVAVTTDAAEVASFLRGEGDDAGRVPRLDAHPEVGGISIEPSGPTPSTTTAGGPIAPSASPH